MPAPAPLPPALFAAVARHWGFSSLRPIQEQAIRASLAGRDSLVVMPTGGGKSLCFQAPAVVRGGLTVVISPLIALMKDQVDNLTRIGVPAARLDSTLNAAERASTAEGIRNGTTRLVFTSPERLVNTDVFRMLQNAGANTIAVDEAHCVSHWGHDFRPEYRQLARLREFFPGAAVHAYTATATEQVRRDIAQQLGLKQPEILVGNFDRPNLIFRVLPRLDLQTQVREVLNRHAGDAGIVYCLRRKDVDEMTTALKAAGYRALPYHAGMDNESRRATQEAFAAEEADIVVATVAFGMGIDRSNVRFVVHAAMPKTIEHYQQETGRAGRDGLQSECVLLHSGADFVSLKAIIEKSAEEAQTAAEYVTASIKHLDEMARYCRGAVCRHKALVQHFGQTYDAPNCGACDLCLGDTQEVPDGVTVAKKILSCVARVKESFGIAHVIDVLRGADTATIRARGHHELSTHGLLKSVPKADLRDWVYQLIGQDVLVQSGDEYPLLKLNPASWAVMNGKQMVRLIQLARREKRGSSAASAQPFALPAGADAKLFEALRQLRRQEASRAGVKPEQVFPDTVLAEMARGRPTTEDALRRISGVGDYRLQSYGRAFLKAIIAYCLRTGLMNDVPLPKSALAPRTAPVALPPATTKPGGKKELAFKMFRAGAAITDVVNKTELVAATITDYLAEFVRTEKPASIFGWVPEDVCERVAAAAEIHGTAKLKPVFLELNGEVSYDAIRVVFALLDTQA
ncbi:atp-dependent dna helicase : ATP-dependent DNA helicase RecQ OS=Rhodopirellula baltica SH28 GN=RBSH_06099 PE=4 SV=1: DEAD: Helicase_C: RQC: HRDC: HTH_40 [Gemmata massiliana]|uniref:DNA helicase RecQ n=1 Tax=Gemmata massiliana TaxID=1210884 RepID=A0A6P2CUF2_9BACT|nr:DNA helicase RecQ [Gemmata massiliana]VTR92599.1 atp-dependent dna helicase : ATP-dependent DNA helicase RecQ OS=Rhodopirellula baltica SH28 GN=RBSH_06099 PE=4 SV=1: DEAD: Helicase_C: RQC: HRDC: HTH_40 [Gemmata massiliana]